MDRFSPVAAAHIRVLVLPVGQIERQTFLDFVRRLQDEAAIIQHKDLKPIVGQGDFLLSPAKFERGCLLLHYSTSGVGEATLHLSPYEIFREPLLVIGVGKGLGDDGEEEDRKELKAATDYMRERHPRVVHRYLLSLREDEDNTGKLMANVTTVGKSHQAGDPSLVKAMRTVAVRFLRELSTYVQALQASPSIPTPGQTSRSQQRASWMRDVENRSNAGPRNVTSPPPPGEDGPSRPPSRSLASPATSFDQMPNSNATVNALSRSDSNRAKNGRGSSQDRVSVQGFGTNTSSEKAKKRGKARVGIVVGSIYMMAGMWNEALQRLVENTNQARTLHDQLWYAKGLENIIVCQLLQAWKAVGFQVPTLCQQAIEKSISKQAAQRFSTGPLADPGPNVANSEISTRKLSEMLPDLVRQIVVLYRSSEGSLELPSLVVCEATVRLCKLLAMLHDGTGNLDRMALDQIVKGGNTGSPEQSQPRSNPFKSSSLQGSRLLSKSAIAEVLVTATSANDDTIAIPEQLTILGGIASVYSVLHMDRKKAMTIKDLVVKLTAALNQARKLGAAEMGIHPAASLSAEHGTESLTVSLQESGGMLSMIADVANIYGVHLIGGEANSEDETTEQRLQHTRPRAFGSEALQFSTLRELLALCEASPDPYGILRLIASFFASAGPRAAVDDQPRSGGVAIAQAEQAHLASTISRTIGVSQQLGLTDTQAEYWDPFLLRGVAFSPRASAIELIDWAKLKGTRPASSDGDPANPLLYDPNARRQATAEQSAILVEGETIECLLTMQNPYEVALDIESVKFVTEGVELESKHQVLHLGAARLQQLSVSLTPKSTGKVEIKGCRIKLASFREEFFPIIVKPWSQPNSLIVKNIGQEARSGDEDPKQKAEDPKHVTVSADVIPPLPILVLKRTSLVESSLMLLEGEMKTFDVTIENVSDTKASILEVLGSVEGLTMADKSAPVVPPKESVNMTLKIVGRAGMTQLRADIFHAGPEQEPGYARMLSVPIAVTVNAALQAHHLDVSESEKDGVLCASFDLGNAWPKSISFACSVKDGKEWSVKQQSTIAPGEVQRIYLDVSRWIHEVKGEPNSEEIRRALVERMRITWSMNSRNGEVPLQNLTLPAEALAILRGSPIATRISLPDHDATTSTSTAAVLAKTGSFLTVRVTVRNRSARSAPLLVELQPASAGMSDQQLPDNDNRHQMVAGSLSRFVAALKPGETRDVDFALCPLLIGALALSASVRSALGLQSGRDGEVLGRSKGVVVRVGE
jgi:hypothetical protein